MERGGQAISLSHRGGVEEETDDAVFPGDSTPETHHFTQQHPRLRWIQRALAVGALTVLVGCASREENSQRFAERRVSLEIPNGWSVSGFSETVFPRRLAAASYRVSRADVEGDCGGLAAVERLPNDGAYLVLIDYGGNFDPDLKGRSDFKQRLPLTLEDGQLAEFECFGRSYVFRFIVGGRGLQAHIGLGSDADSKTRAKDARPPQLCARRIGVVAGRALRQHSTLKKERQP